MRAACKASWPRQVKRGASDCTKAGHKAKARAWFRKVGDGATL